MVESGSVTQLSQSVSQLEAKPMVRGLDPLSMVATQAKAKEQLAHVDLKRHASVDPRDHNQLLQEFKEKDQAQLAISQSKANVPYASKAKYSGQRAKESFPQEDLVQGEVAECRLMVKEVTKLQLIGELFLSNYKVLFRPNGYKQSECAKFCLPYGYITQVQSSSNELKTQGTITLTSKDERVLKFKFENAPGQFRESLQIIVKYAVIKNVGDLFCFKSNWGKFTYDHVAQAVSDDFHRLGIPNRFQWFRQVT